ncbi:nucleotidyltransferase domain-containing protein [Haloarculaceae archaeon H-GB2-1]|nr:nucleotidyltransferase domain-containing protein [Haloarculaceae archaeon H-GB1-1]MEA5409637.1 nucleotidyltransferase domain-containing protein [Haloarculaceae archaeon H-GB2-1]
MASAGESDIDGVDIEGMQAYLSTTDVTFAVLFGSHARGTASRSSDVDIAVRFPETMDEYDRFHARNQIDAELQSYTTGFVDVSDVDELPTPVAYAALRDGLSLVGDEAAIDAYRAAVRRAYEETRDDRERERREFLDRLARGET